MAVLNTQQRNAMPRSEFALPGGRFPLNDRVHDEKALQLAPRSLHAGNISVPQEHAIQAKARAKLRGMGGGGSAAVSLKDALIHKMMG